MEVLIVLARPMLLTQGQVVPAVCIFETVCIWLHLVLPTT